MKDTMYRVQIVKLAKAVSNLADNLSSAVIGTIAIRLCAKKLEHLEHPPLSLAL